VTRRTTYSALALALLLGACESPVSTPDPQEAPATLTLSVDWAALDRVASASVPAANGAALLVGEVPNDPYPVNRVGVRIEYPTEDAVFIQTVNRQTAQTSGVISLVLPPANDVKMYLLAVHENLSGSDKEVAKAMAYSDLGKLVPGKAFKISTTSLALIPATWEFASGVPFTTLPDGTRQVTATSTTSRYAIRMNVTDPFGSFMYRTGTRVFFGLNGSGVENESYAAGTRVMRQDVESWWGSDWEFYPYINGGLFNLGRSARFRVLPEAKANITFP